MSNIDDYKDRFTSPIGAIRIDPKTRKPITDKGYLPDDVYTETILDASKHQAFKGHDGVLNDCFSANIKKYGHQNGLWTFDEYSDWGVWFPKFLVNKDGEPVPAERGSWINTLSPDKTFITERKEPSEGESDYLTEDGFSQSFIRLVFGYFKEEDSYVFLGAYVGNNGLSKEYQHVFTRIATKVEVNRVGGSVYEIKLIDEDRSDLELTSFVVPDDAKKGTIGDWIIRNNNFAITKLPPSLKDDLYISIPKDAGWFFDVYGLEEGFTIGVYLFLGNKHFYTGVSSEEGEYRLLLNQSHLNLLLKDISLDDMPLLSFERKGTNKYAIELLASNKPVKEPTANKDIDSLKDAAIKHSSDEPTTKEVATKQINRNTNVADYAKARANGICQLCGKPAPFNDANGNPYLESHHIIWLSRGGADSVDNTVALCPNCHKKMHIIDNPNDVKILLEKAKTTE